MNKTTYWILILITLVVNVIILQTTVEAYFGQEYEIVYRNTGIGIVSAIIALIVYFIWKKAEYKK